MRAGGAAFAAVHHALKQAAEDFGADFRPVALRAFEQLLAQFGKFAPLRKNTPETADFVVLRSINIPSVLIELGYLTNSAEEKQLDTAAQRRRFAAGIADAVEQYWKTAAR